MRAYINAVDNFPLDVNRVLSGMSHDVESYKEIIGAFHEELEMTLSALGAARALGRRTLIHVLHELANSLGAVGAFAAALRVRALEAGVSNGTLDEPCDVAREASAILVETDELLTAWLHDRDGTSY